MSAGRTYLPSAETPAGERSLGQLCHDSLVHAAKLKCEALRARKLAERTFDRLLLEIEGKTSVDWRKAKVATDARYIAVDDVADTAESDAIIAKAKADGIQVRFSEWQSVNATTRAEMTLR